MGRSVNGAALFCARGWGGGGGGAAAKAPDEAEASEKAQARGECAGLGLVCWSG
jgi:hypothetical protein